MIEVGDLVTLGDGVYTRGISPKITGIVRIIDAPLARVEWLDWDNRPGEYNDTNLMWVNLYRLKKVDM